jgi:hypothetical protein
MQQAQSFRTVCFVDSKGVYPYKPLPYQQAIAWAERVNRMFGETVVSTMPVVDSNRPLVEPFPVLSY